MKKMRNKSREWSATTVKAYVGHPAVLGYLVGNEISSTMARWLGVRQVIEFVEHLVRIGRAIDPDAFSFPTPRFRRPNICCRRTSISSASTFTSTISAISKRYLLRLQNLTEERPLILGEFGMDTIRHSQDEQAEMLGWHIESVAKCGLAGTILFSWTDEWFTGGQEVTDWAFGIVTRDRQPKKSFYALQEKFGRGRFDSCRIVPLPKRRSFR